MAVGHAAHQEPEAETLGLRRSKGEGRITLEHGLFGRPEHLHLEPVIHDRQRAHPDGLCRPGQGGERRSDRPCTTRPGEAGHMHIEFHLVLRSLR